jgi:hypothetical protein
MCTYCLLRHTHRNYCTYDTALLARLVFDIFDPDRLRVLAMPDYDAMLRMLYNTDTADPAVLALLAINGSSDESTVSYTEFVQLAETHPQILQVCLVHTKIYMRLKLVFALYVRSLCFYKEQYGRSFACDITHALSTTQRLFD